MASLIQSKLQSVGTTIFTIMTELAQQYHAINLAQGFPDFGADPELGTLVAKSIQNGKNQYAPMAGIPGLRQWLSDRYIQKIGVAYSPDTEITITSGGTEALFSAIAAIVKPDDEIIVFDPCYDSYVPAIEVNGGIPVYIPLQYPDYAIDWNLVKKQITRNTRAIIINTPHNPTGRIFTEADLKALNDVTKNNNIIIISDEVYEDIIFDKQLHQSICTQDTLRERSFKIGSFGKNLHVTGWKVGYCLAPEPLMKEFRKVHQFVTFSTATPLQYAILEYLESKSGFFDELGAFYQQKRDFFLKLIANSNFQPLECSGTYFQLCSYGNISDKHDFDFAKELIEQHGVATVPISALRNHKTDDKVLRFCFAKTEETLAQAALRLCRI